MVNLEVKLRCPICFNELDKAIIVDRLKNTVYKGYCDKCDKIIPLKIDGKRLIVNL